LHMPWGCLITVLTGMQLMTQVVLRLLGYGILSIVLFSFMRIIMDTVC